MLSKRRKKNKFTRIHQIKVRGIQLLLHLKSRLQFVQQCVLNDTIVSNTFVTV